MSTNLDDPNFEPTPPNNDWELSDIGEPNFYLPDPPELMAEKRAAWEEK